MGVKPTLRGEPLRATTTQAAPRVEPVSFAAAPAPFTASTGASRTPAASTAPRSGVNPWLIGAGVGAALIGLAVTMSRTMSPSEPSAPPAAVLSQATPSPEDTLLQSQPPSAGPVTPAPEAQPAETPAAPAPAVEPKAAATPTKVAEAPTPPLPVVRGDPATTPRTLAQASPPPVRESALQPLAPVTPAVTPPVQAAPPVVAATPAPAPIPQTPPAAVPPETVPPVAQAAPQPQPPVAAPEDSSITVNVRTALAADSTLAAVPIAVSTDHGVVKLEGQAPDASTRERATVVAAATSGVKAVDNRLTVPPVATVGGVTPTSGG
ncbi:hypothetical protein ASD35_16490 [Pelomonas sp. Root1444]|nr:hypothetical protein ASD35_16490 [Pelomonas sp. Root1444]